MRPISMFGPDFRFAYDEFLQHGDGLGVAPAAALGSENAIVGARIDWAESLFHHDLWMAMERSHYMQSSWPTLESTVLP